MKVSSNHECILPRSRGCFTSLRHDTPGDIREHGEMAEGAKRSHRCQHCGRLNSLPHHFYFWSKYFRCYSCGKVNQYNKFKNEKTENKSFEEKYCQKGYQYCSGGIFPPPEKLNEYYISSKWIEHANGCWSVKWNGVCYLITGNSWMMKKPQTEFVCHRGFDFDKDDPFSDIDDGVLDKNGNICCGNATWNARGAPKDAILSSLEDAMKLCKRDFLCVSQMISFDKRISKNV